MKSQLLPYFCVSHQVGGSCTPARTKRFSYPRVFADRLSPRWARIRDRESQFQAPLHKPLLDTNHHAATDIQSLGYLPIGVTGFTLTLIAQQQLTCYQIVLGWSPAGVHHRLQKPSLLLTQSHGITVVIDSHACAPSPRLSDLVRYRKLKRATTSFHAFSVDVHTYGPASSILCS